MIARADGRLRSHNRFAYSPIVGRPAFEWPGGKRLAVYVALNLEHYAFGEGLVEELVPGIPQPDVLNHSWREYGNRVGAWRRRHGARALVQTTIAPHRAPSDIPLPRRCGSAPSNSVGTIDARS